MNELDQFVKHGLKVNDYFRYTDDFVVLAERREFLEDLLLKINLFLKEKLALDLHPKKIIFRQLHQGVDFLGYVIFPHHRLVRRKTVRRMMKKIGAKRRELEQGKITRSSIEQSLQSYLGVLSHADTHRVAQDILNRFWGEIGAS